MFQPQVPTHRLWAVVSIPFSVSQVFSVLFSLSPYVPPKGSGLCYSLVLKALMLPQISSTHAYLRSEFQTSYTDLGHLFLYLLPLHGFPRSLSPMSLFSILCLHWVFWFPIPSHVSCNYNYLRVKVARKKRKWKITNTVSTLVGLQESLFPVSLVKGEDYLSVINGCIAALPLLPPPLEDSLMIGACAAVPPEK